MNAWKDLLRDVSCINKGYKMGDSSKTENNEKWYIISAYSMPPWAMQHAQYLSAKTIFFVSFELNKLRGKCLKVQASFQGVT